MANSIVHKLLHFGHFDLRKKTRASLSKKKNPFLHFGHFDLKKKQGVSPSKKKVALFWSF